MTPHQFAVLSGILKQRSGLSLTPEKLYLVESRLTSLLARFGLESLGALVLRLSGGEETLVRAVCEAMATHESSFFRDRAPFDHLKALLPQIAERNRDTRFIRIWSAACSTGQEPYSIAMLLREQSARLGNVRLELIASDLSTEIIARARAGLFSQFEVQRGLPIQYLVKHFRQKGQDWELEPAVREMVQFRTLNLLEEFRHLGAFDVIFCRNVLIYFDLETKRLVFERLAGCLTAGGILYLGSAESPLGITDRLIPAKGCPGAYETASPSGAAAANRPMPALAVGR